MAELPVFFDEDAQAIIDGMKADMETRLGKSIAPSDVEMLLINGFAYREQLLRIQANETARQNMVSFSRGSSLDYLGLLVGVVRLPAQAASCTLQFNLVSGHSALTLPAGVRVQSLDGTVTFITTAAVDIPASGGVSIISQGIIAAITWKAVFAGAPNTGDSITIAYAFAPNDVDEPTSYTATAVCAAGDTLADMLNDLKTQILADGVPIVSSGSDFIQIKAWQIEATASITSVLVPAVSSVEVPAVCTTEGKQGNEFAPGSISIILDPQAFVTSATNTNITTGGSDEETDDQLRERIELAPSTFSVAGPYGAYKFWAKSANPAIVDVAVVGPPTFDPGEVHLFPLLENGVLPNETVLEDVLAVCDDEKRRPLTDTVIVAAPEEVEYAIEVELTLFNDAIQADTEAEVTANLNAYKADRLNKLGLDVIRNQIIGKCMIKDKVYNVNLVSPASNTVANAYTYTRCTGITVSTVGFNEG